MKAEDVPRWLLVWPEPLQVVLKCPVTYVSVPVLDVVAKKQHGVLNVIKQARQSEDTSAFG